MTNTVASLKRNNKKAQKRLAELLPAGEYLVVLSPGSRNKRVEVSGAKQMEETLYRLTYDCQALYAAIFNAAGEQILVATRHVGGMTFEE